MNAQLLLNILGSEKKARKLADLLISDLNLYGSLTRQQLVDMGWKRRYIRLARRYSNGDVIFTQRGYHLTRIASQDDINECINTFESQAKVMMEEANCVRKKAHGRIS